MLKINKIVSNYHSCRNALLLGFFFLGVIIGLQACQRAKKVDRQVKADSTESTIEKPVQPTNAPTPGATSPVSNTASFYSTEKQVIAKGQQLFSNNCTSCHDFIQRGIGPNLSGVTTRESPVWLTKFIHNAPEVIKSGDDRAIRLMGEYKQLMPPFTTLSETDIQAILAYMHSHQPAPSIDYGAENLGEVLKDPIPNKIPKSGLTLMLEEVTTAPATAEKVPLARINKMLVLPGKKARLFIEDLRGILYELENKKLRAVWDISQERPAFINAPGHGTGLGSYAFHPQFYKNGLFYTTHTEKAKTARADFAYADSLPVSLQWVLTEWKFQDPTAAVFSGTGREMLRINMVNNIHGVQELTFNPLAKPRSPDYGLLYIGVGDGGAAERGYAFLCNTNTQIWSSVLRIDPSGTNSRNGHYGIPSINPFAEDSDPNTLGEVFADGFRNPNRISWAPDGKMLIAEIGLTNVEELNIGKAGANYGWPAREGTFLLNYKGKMDRVYALPENDSQLNYTYPVAQYDHDEGNAFSGGYVFTDPQVPLLQGKYVFGDIVSGRVYFVENSQLKLGQQTPIQEMDIKFGGKLSTFQDITGNQKADLRFGIGLKNEFYIFTKSDGRIWKITGAGH